MAILVNKYGTFDHVSVGTDSYPLLLEILAQSSSQVLIVLNLEKSLPQELKDYLETMEHDKRIRSILFSDFVTKTFETHSPVLNEENLKSLLQIKHHPINNFFKRVFDFLFSLSAIMLSFPFMVLFALLIKVMSPKDSILFTQKRLGLHGTPFRVLKFRTMIPNAEAALKKMLQEDKELEAEYLKYRKLQNDPRIIPLIGNFLRKSSLDELPQFFNVLLGEMSIVGPRPYIPEEFYRHTQTHIDIITSVKPGVTGYWQVTDRNNATFEGRVDSDIEYIQNQHFWLDLTIIAKTIWVVVLRQGS
jgi:undecaprenyl-phosphate galactose phosphotransferase